MDREKFHGATHLSRLLKRFATDNNRTFAADSLASLNVHIQHDPHSHDLPSWPPLAQDINLLHTHLRYLRLNASSIDASSVLYPPPYDCPWPNSPPFSGYEWADLFDTTMSRLSKHQEDLNSNPNDNNQAYAIRREPDWDNSFERLIARGQRTDEIQGVFSRTLWKVVSILEAGNFLGCLAADCSSGGFVEDGYVLRSELICILALVCSQLLNRIGCGNDNVYALPLATTVITFTNENVRVLQSYITLPESGPPQLHIIIRLNMAINKVAGRDDQALKYWGTVVSWMRFSPNNSGRENASLVALHVHKRLDNEKDKSGRPGATHRNLASETISEHLFSGSMDKGDMSSSSTSSFES